MKDGPLIIKENVECQSVGTLRLKKRETSEVLDANLRHLKFELNQSGCELDFMWPSKSTDLEYKQTILYGVLVGTFPPKTQLYIAH